jgi:hypothetical protein
MLILLLLLNVASYLQPLLLRASPENRATAASSASLIAGGVQQLLAAITHRPSCAGMPAG